MEFLTLVETACWRVDDALDRCEREREEAAGIELGSALLIQTQVRRHFAQSEFKCKRKCASEIERVFRGNLDRRSCRSLRRERAKQHQLDKFAYFASVIQHCFRGYWSRRYKHDFYARKAYISDILEKSNQLRLKLAANRERAAQEEQERRMRDMQDEFKQIACNLHHLISTKARPGIYNSPYCLDGKPTAFGVPIEDHLRECTVEVLRTQGMRKESALLPKKRIKKSILASSEYDAAREAERQESRRSKSMRISNREFQTRGKGPLANPESIQAISSGTPFIDVYRIQKSSRDAPLSSSQKPFHSAVPKNQLFDDIMDREERAKM